MTDFISTQIVLVAIAGIFSQWIAWRLHVPSIIFLLAMGFLLGPIAHIIKPDLFMGDLLKPAIAAAVAIILFEGSLQLHFKELRESLKAIRQIIFLGAPIGWLLISYAAYYIGGLDWPVAVTLGGILIVTGPTVIMPMLRQARLNPRVGSVLKWEGIVNDPLGVILAILAFEYFVASQEGHANAGFFIGRGIILLVISLSSFLLGHIIKRIFERGHMPEYLKTPFLLTVVLTLFFGCNFMLHESGLIAVTILGITLTNIYTQSLEDIKKFKETITIMLVSGVFILLTAGLDLSVMLELNGRGILFILCLLFLIRPLTFFLCSIGTNMTRQEVILTGLIAPRGIVCAAMAGVIGPLLAEAGFADGHKILPIAFTVVVLSVVLHSLMIKPLSRRLNLTSSEINGVIIVGAYPWSIQLAEVLKSRDVPVLLVDTNWLNLSHARLSDIPVYHGQLLSEETEFALEFNKYDALIAASSNEAYNALLCEKFGYDYGTERVFRINTNAEGISEKQKISSSIQGRTFITSATTLNDLIQKFEKEWQFRSSRIGRKEKDSDLIIPEENETCLLIGIISKTGKIYFYCNESHTRAKPKEDEIILYFSSEPHVADLTTEI